MAVLWRAEILNETIGRRVVVVRAFVKKTPRAEIELASRRAKEIT